MLEINKIYNMDCLQGLPLIPDNSIDLIVTSPPYNCDIQYDIYKDNLPWDEYLAWCKQWLAECLRILKPDGRMCLNVLVEMGIENNKRRVSPMIEFYKIMQDVGFKISALPMWTDNHRVKYTSWGSWLKPSSPYIYCPYEVVIIAYKDHWKKDKKGESTVTKEGFMMGCSGIWNLPTERKQLTKANFHVELPKLCINLLTYKGDLVCDPFMGAGTTAVACKMTDRNYIGFEISDKYCNIANERINNYK